MNITKCEKCGCTKTAEDRVAFLDAENARLQGRVEEITASYESMRRSNVYYKAQAKKLEEGVGILKRLRQAFQDERDEARTLAERRKKALEAYPLGFENHHPHMETPYDHECATCRFWRLGRDAINMTPEEALRRAAIEEETLPVG